MRAQNQGCPMCTPPTCSGLSHLTLPCFSSARPPVFLRPTLAPCSCVLLHRPLLRSSSACPLTVLVPFPNSSIRTRDCSVALFTAFATCWVPGGQRRVSLAFEACNTLTRLPVSKAACMVRPPCWAADSFMVRPVFCLPCCCPRASHKASVQKGFCSIEGRQQRECFSCPHHFHGRTSFTIALPQSHLSSLHLTWLRSIMKVERPREMDSQLRIRVKMASTAPISASSAGTKLPTRARKVIKPT